MSSRGGLGAAARPPAGDAGDLSMRRTALTGESIVSLALAVLVLCALAVAESNSYLLFHSLVEVFSIAVAGGIFMVAWNSRRFTGEGYLTLIGIAYLHAGIIDLLHTLAYQGMGVFQLGGADVSVQLWIAARYLQSISLVIAALCVKRRIAANVVLPLYSIVTSVLLLSVFYWRVFPIGYVEKLGLTPFKKDSEYAICFILVGAMVLFLRHRKDLDPRVLRLLLWSIAATIAAELAFTLYVSVSGVVSMVGHIFKLASFYLIYKAVVETSLMQPYDTLFRDLKRSEEALRLSELRLRMTLDEVGDGIVVVDRTGIVRYVNPAARTMLGVDTAELVGTPFGFAVEAGRSADIEVGRPDGRKTAARMRTVKTTWEGQPAYLISLHAIADANRQGGAP
jgi:PAS domain-containing protein